MLFNHHLIGIFSILLICVNAYIVPPEGRIVGGKDTSIEDIPWQVSILYNNSHFCGGAIINENFIITAAHCMDKSLLPLMKIRAGSSIRLKGGQLVEIDGYRSHQNFSRQTIQNDISIIRLKNKLKFNKYVQPVQLPESGTTVKDDEDVIVSGWGLLHENGEQPTILQSVHVLLMNQPKCKKYYTHPEVTVDMICTYYPYTERGVCNTDSGGPLFLNRTLIGVVSWSQSCISVKYPTVYANVAYQRQWIDRTLGEF